MDQVSLFDHIYQYELKPECRNGIKSPKNKTLIQATISMFCSLHDDTYKSCFQQISDIFKDIQKNEKVILFENEKIYYHTYCILTLLTQYLAALDYYYSDNYKKTLAGLRGSEKQVLEKFHQHEANTLDLSNAFIGDDRLKATIFENLYRDRETTELLLNFFTFFPLQMYKVPESDKWCTPILQKIIEHFSSTYIASEEIIYKSLAIHLNAYLRLVMQIESGHSKRVTQEIMEELFNYKFYATSADLLRNVYISGRLNSLPIFKHGKEPHIVSQETIKKFDTFINEVFNEFEDIEYAKMTATELLDENVVKLFLTHKPVEFLQEKQ